MDKAELPSPAPSNSNINSSTTAADDVLHSQIQQLIQHNASVPPVDAHSQISSNPHSRYSSPVPQQKQQQAGIPVYDHGSPYATASSAPTYSGGYHQQSYQMEPSPYPQLPDTGSSMTPHNTYSTPATSPPTPLQMDSMTTRSGRAINRAHGDTQVLGPQMQMSRVMKSSPKPRSGGGGAGAKRAARKKRSKDDGDEKPAVVLEAPLSVLVREITMVQDTNIEEYVNRPLDVRQAEVRDSKEGKVKRPMNAFMLYRKAYQNRAKEWKKHDNHQIISQICGTSWNMEGQDLRDQFDTWAKVERANHKLAFPDYKFAPAKAKNKKTNTSARGSGAARESDLDDGSDLEGYEWNTESPPSRNATRSVMSMYGPDAEYRPPGRSTYVDYRSPVPHHTPLPYPHHQSSFQYSNPGKPRPGDYGSSMGPNPYYQPQDGYMRSAYPHPMAPQGYGPPMMNNVYGPRVNSPGSSFHGSPIDQYGDLMGSGYPPPPPQQPQVAAMPHSRIHEYQHHQIDPSLMGQHSSQFDALGILGLDQSDPLGGYSLDSGALGGTTTGNGHHVQQQHHFEPFQHQPQDDHGLGSSDPWHDDPTTSAAAAMPSSLHDTKLDQEWETLAAESGQFHLESIDDILGTTDSPGG